jgi:hypothetical protein
VSGLDVFGTLDVSKAVTDACLKVRFERSQFWWWWQPGCTLDGDLAEHIGQLATVLFTGFVSDQSIFGLIRSQGTPPVWLWKLSELELGVEYGGLR